MFARLYVVVETMQGPSFLYKHFKFQGFSLAEILLAMGLLAIALLALIGQSAILAKANQKTDDSTVAFDVAESVIERLSREALMDHPGGRNLRLWQHNSLVDRYDHDTETVAFTDYSWEAFVTNVTNSITSETVGTGPTGVENENTRLKRIDLKVEWWGGDAGERNGTGQLRVEVTRLVKATRVI